VGCCGVLVGSSGIVVSYIRLGSRVPVPVRVSEWFSDFVSCGVLWLVHRSRNLVPGDMKVGATANLQSVTLIHAGFLLFFTVCFTTLESRDSSVGMAKDYELGDRGSIPDRVKRSFFSPQSPDRFWGSPSFLSNGYRGLSPRGQNGRDVKIITIFHLVPRPRMMKLYLHSTIRLYGMVLN
jgi:hypothetical protein